MKNWVTAPGEYWRNRADVVDFCTKNFGPEHTKKRSSAGKMIDNHGNWELTHPGKLSFRFQKDCTWFVLGGPKDMSKRAESPGAAWTEIFEREMYNRPEK